MLSKGARIVGLSILGLVTFGVIGLIFGFIVESLWNWLMPAIFQLPKIGYWQAFGIVILGKLIFGNFGPRHGFGPQYRGPHIPHHFNHHHRHHSHCNHEWEDEKWRIKGGWRNWDYYEDWWREEGKTAFEGYVDRVTSPDNVSEKNKEE
jgi:hypothetical protein